MKTKWFSRLAALSLVVGSLGATAVAQAQTTTDYGSDVGEPTQMNSPGGDAFAMWCDQVTETLNEAQSIGWNLYHRQMYTQARASILNALQTALNSMTIPGSAFRPATYREIQRTIALIQSLDATQPTIPGGESPALKAKMIAYVALQRISFISYVKDAVDVTYNIPCRFGCYGDNPQYEGALAQEAAEQLSRAQNYSSVVGGDGMVYPIDDTPYYFVIVSKAARWAAQDLATSLFNKRFSCAILNLNTLGTKAASYQAMLGDVSAVQEIHHIVGELVDEMGDSPYGCGYRW